MSIPMMINVSDAMYENMWFPPMSVRIPIVILFGMVILVGITGNILVLALIILVKSMQTVVNCSLALLSIADLLILTLLPVLPISHEFFDHQSFVGRYMCDFLNCYDRGAVVFSVLTYLFVSFNRYFAVCHPLRSLHQSSRTSFIWSMLAIVTMSALISFPYKFISKYESNNIQYDDNITRYGCFLAWDKPWEVIYETIVNVTVFFCPVPFLVGLNFLMVKKIKQESPGETSRQNPSDIRKRQAKQQVVHMLVIVIGIFIICQWPFAILTLLELHFPYTLEGSFNPRTYALYWIARILMYVNSAANPIVYFVVSTKFRRAFSITFRCFRRIKLHIAERGYRKPQDSGSGRSASSSNSSFPTHTHMTFSYM